MYICELEKFKQKNPEAHIDNESSTVTIEKKLQNFIVNVVIHMEEDFYKLIIKMKNLQYEPSKNALKLLQLTLGDSVKIKSSNNNVTIYSDHSKDQFIRIEKQIDNQFKLLQSSLLLVTEKPISFFEL